MMPPVLQDSVPLVPALHKNDIYIYIYIYIVERVRASERERERERVRGQNVSVQLVTEHSSFPYVQNGVWDSFPVLMKLSDNQNKN
jgi:hypothetical protein